MLNSSGGHRAKRAVVLRTPSGGHSFDLRGLPTESGGPATSQSLRCSGPCRRPIKSPARGRARTPSAYAEALKD